MTTVKQGIVDGRTFTYSEHTTFTVQVGKGSKGSYRTRLKTNNWAQAAITFVGTNIGDGYKKRILITSGDGFAGTKVLVRRSNA